MRDGSGNKLPQDEVDKVRSPQVRPDPDSLKTVSIDPGRARKSPKSESSEAGEAHRKSGPGEAPTF